MTVERDPSSDETVQMPKPDVDAGADADELEDIDPEKTLVRESWESVAIRRVAPHVAAVQREMTSETGKDSAAHSRYGWESEGLRRLAEGLRRIDGQ